MATTGYEPTTELVDTMGNEAIAAALSMARELGHHLGRRVAIHAHDHFPEVLERKARLRDLVRSLPEDVQDDLTLLLESVTNKVADRHCRSAFADGCVHCSQS